MSASMTRRGFLGVAAGAAISATGFDRMAGGTSGGGATLYEPRRMYSRGGRLALTLVAEKRQVFVAGRRREAIVYNGSFPAPTWVVNPGDRIQLRLVNRLAEPTNLHTHGFHV